MIDLTVKELELLRAYFESKSAFQRKKVLKKINEYNTSELQKARNMMRLILLQERERTHNAHLKLENEYLRYALGGK